MAGLFGEGGDSLLRQRQADRMGMLSAMGNVPLGTLGGGTAGLLVGEGLRDAGPNGQFQKQGLLQQAQQEVMGQGLNPGDPGFADAAVRALTSRGLLEEAQQARVMGLQMEKQALEVQGMRQDLTPDTGSVQRRFEGLVLAGIDPATAQRMAPNQKVFESIMSNAFKKDSAPAQIQGYNLARQQGFEGSFLDYQTALKKAGASNVSVTVGDKPLKPSELSQLRNPDGSPLLPGTTMNQAAEQGATAIPPEEQAAATATAKVEALREDARGPAQAALDNLTNIMSDGSAASALSPAGRAKFNAAVNRMVEAVVQFRLPGREASDPTKQAMRGALNSQILSMGTDAGMAVVQELKAELQGGGSSKGKRRRFNPATGRLE